MYLGSLQCKQAKYKPRVAQDARSTYQCTCGAVMMRGVEVQRYEQCVSAWIWGDKSGHNWKCAFIRLSGDWSSEISLLFLAILVRF